MNDYSRCKYCGTPIDQDSPEYQRWMDKESGYCSGECENLGEAEAIGIQIGKSNTEQEG